MIRKRPLKTSLCLMLCALLCAGCSGAPAESSSASAAPASSAAPAASSAPASSGPSSQPAAEEGLYDSPLTDKPVTFSYWVELSGNAAAAINSYSDNKVYGRMEEMTGVHIDFLHPTAGQGKEQFNLMIASRDLPDLIEYGWIGYNGGPEKAISDGIILKLNDLIDAYAPDAKTLMQSSPVVAKQSVTDNGSYYAFMAVGESNGNTQSGPFLRADWLADLGLEDPTTLEEWTAILEKFKSEKGAEFPFTGTSGTFLSDTPICGAFGIGPDFYQKDGKVKYGPIDPEYKQYLAFVKDWYDRGLLDPDFAANDSKTLAANMTGGKSGFMVGFAGGSMGTYLNAMRDTDPAFDLKPIEYPKMQDGSDPLFHHRAWEVRTSGSLAITTECKQPELAAKWANYFYTEEGGLLKNFGIEGESYTVENGTPVLTEMIEKNPDGLSRQQALGVWSRGDTPSPGPVIKLPDGNPRVRETVEVWNRYADNATAVLLPPVTQTPEEAEELATLTTNINAYKEEMVIKFIMGRESLDNFDSFIDQLMRYDVERVIALKQAALDRYNAR